MTTGIRTFRVLVVDNDLRVQEKADDELAELREEVSVDGVHIEWECCSTVDEAKSRLADEFFDTVFIDLFLGPGSGVSVIRLVATHSPSAKVFVMSRWFVDRDAKRPSQYLVDFLSLISPVFVPTGVIDKAGGQARWFSPGVRALIEAWRRPQLAVEGIEDVVGAVLRARERMDAALSEGQLQRRLRSSQEQLYHEVERLLFDVFGRVGSEELQAGSVVRIESIRQGFSSSVVFQCEPRIRVPGIPLSIPGNRCVVKIGPVNEVKNETERYEKVVRFGAALEHRVELYTTVYADSLGAICYSFAGGNASVLRTLDDLLRQGADDVWHEVVDKIFHDKSTNWYSVRSRTVSLRDYYMNEHNVRLEHCLASLTNWLRALAHDVDGLRYSDGELLVGESRFVLPTRALLAHHGFVHHSAGCLVHGDLHGGNIVVDANGRPYFIDFQSAGLAPRLIDFAALQVTARFLDVPEERVRNRLVDRSPDFATIERIWLSIEIERDLAMGRSSAGETRSGRNRPFSPTWIRFAESLRQRLLANFDATDEEILCTYAAYCLSLFRFADMDDLTRMRLLVWLSALTECLKRDFA